MACHEFCSVSCVGTALVALPTQDSLFLPQEERMAEEERIRKEKERDYLAPFLARIGDPPQLSAREKEEVKEECLKDLRSRLVEVANIIQSHFEQVSVHITTAPIPPPAPPPTPPPLPSPPSSVGD